MAERWRTMTAGRGRVSFGWDRRPDGKWARTTMFGVTERSGAAVEKNLDHLMTAAYDSEAECRRALERAAKAWLYEHD